MHKLRKFFADILHAENISLSRFIFLFTISVAFAAAFIRKVNPELTFFSHRAIGNAVLNGINAKSYVSAYYVCIVIFFAVFWAGNFLLNRLKKLTLNRNLDYEYSLVSDFSFIALINMLIFLYDVLQSKTIQAVPYVIFIAFAFVILHAVLNIILPERFTVNDSETSQKLWTSVIFLLPVFLTYSAHLFMTYGRSSTALLRSPVSLILYAVFYVIARLLIRRRSVINASVRALVPLSFLPLTYITANEIQYTLTKYGIQTDPVKLALIFSVIIILIAVLILVMPKSYSVNESASFKRLENIVLPALLVAFALFKTHIHTITPEFDYLHTGNSIVPAQQLYELGLIPCIDYWAPQHWPVGAYIYSLLNGYNFCEISIGNNLFAAIALTLLCYFVMKKFTGGTFAAVLMCFTPMLQYMNTYYCPEFLPLLYMDKMRQNKRIRDYAVIAVLSLLSFAYTPSSGRTAILASVIMILFSLKDRKDILNAAAGFLGIIFVSGVIYFTLVILRGETIADRISLIQSMANCDTEVGAYWSLIGPWNSPFAIITCYGIMPSAAIICLIFSLRVRNKSSIHSSLIYFLIAALISYLRVFARHSLMEGEQILFFPFIFCVIPLVLMNIKALRKPVMFLMIMVIVLTPYVNTYRGQAMFNGNHGIADAGVKNFEFKEWKPGDIRCDTAGDKLYPGHLRAVLDSVLNENQTFFDGINSHLLYALTEREAPFLHHSVQLIFDEPGQEAYIHQFEKYYEQNKIPVVISYYSPMKEPVPGEAAPIVLCDIDTIPVELSLFKLHEFISTHYDPWLIADGFYLMKAKNSDISYDIPKDSEAIKPYTAVKQNTDMWLLPFIWGNYDAKTSEHFPAELQTVANSAELESNVPARFNLDPETDKSQGNYLYFRVNTDNDSSASENYQESYKPGGGLYLRAGMKSSGVMNITYGDGRANASFFLMPGTHDYLVRISCQYEWMSAKHDEITITSSIPVTLEKFSVLKGD